MKSPSAEAAEILATSGGLAKGGAHAPLPPAVTSIAPTATAPIGVQATPPTSNAAQMNDRQAGPMPAAAPALSAVAPQGTGPASATHAQQPAATAPASLPASDAGTASAPPLSVPVLSTSEAPASASGPASAAVAASPSPAQAAPQSAPATPVRRNMPITARPPAMLPTAFGREGLTKAAADGQHARPIAPCSYASYTPRTSVGAAWLTLHFAASCTPDAFCFPVVRQKGQTSGKPAGTSKPDGYVARPSEANEPLLENPRYRKIKDLNSGVRRMGTGFDVPL